MTYSLKKRKAAVELYIKYGCNAADVIREFGYPHRYALRSWYLEFEESGERRIARVTREEHSRRAPPRS